jgi:hypothetical protein
VDRTPGRPLFFVALLLGMWVSGRVMFDRVALDSQPSRALPGTLQARSGNALPNNDAPAAATAVQIANPKFRPAAVQRIATLARRPTINQFNSPAALPWAAGGQPSGSSLPPWVAAREGPKSPYGSTPQMLAPEQKAGTSLQMFVTPQMAPPDPQRRPKRVTLYAYSFWREKSALTGSVLAPSPQYGGSQSGVIATWDPFGRAQTGPAVLLRAAFTPDGKEREVALGARWKLAESVPLSVTIERRFRAHAIDRFASYVSGGVGDVRIMGPLSLDAFGQAGVVSGRAGGGFFDGQAQIAAPIGKIATAPVKLGAGMWTGGQRGVARLDLGPVLASNMQMGEANARLELSWRFRVTGKATPGSGPSLTISGGF